jgi:hypothetical protein
MVLFADADDAAFRLLLRADAELFGKVERADFLGHLLESVFFSGAVNAVEPEGVDHHRIGTLPYP